MVMKRRRRRRRRSEILPLQASPHITLSGLVGIFLGIASFRGKEGRTVKDVLGIGFSLDQIELCVRLIVLVCIIVTLFSCRLWSNISMLSYLSRLY
jgi:hypothetical protein